MADIHHYGEHAMDKLDTLIKGPTPTAQQPLLGLTMLVVEDSRFASEAFRLLALRSGARIRRADSLFSAQRHLCIYRPAIAIVDLGLPDGDGLSLIEDLAQQTAPITVTMATSGDPAREQEARDAGAHDFLAKPITRLGDFQAAILRHLSSERQPAGPRLISNETVAPDPVALRDDLEHGAALLNAEDDRDGSGMDYTMQFLSGIASSSGDTSLSAGIKEVQNAREMKIPVRPSVAKLAGLLQARITSSPRI